MAGRVRALRRCSPVTRLPRGSELASSPGRSWAGSSAASWRGELAVTRRGSWRGRCPRCPRSTAWRSGSVKPATPTSMPCASASAPGTQGGQLDTSLMASPWDVDPHLVSTPVTLWHGGLDAGAPVEMGRWIAGSVPDCRALPARGGTHLADRQPRASRSRLPSCPVGRERRPAASSGGSFRLGPIVCWHEAQPLYPGIDGRPSPDLSRCTRGGHLARCCLRVCRAGADRREPSRPA